MPRAVAFVSLAGGVAVVAFGIALAFIAAPVVEEPLEAPAVTLEPSDDRRPIDSRSVIRGKVLSVRKKGVAGVAVELVPLFEGREAKVRRTRTEQNGAFRFSDVQIDLGSPYVVEAVFAGTRFPSPTIRVPRGSDPRVDITVADTTTSDDDLTVEVESLAVVGDEQGLQAVHAFEIINRSSRAFVGELQLPLLRGAANIQEGAGLDRRLLELEHGTMLSTKPILPGPNSVTYTYVTQMSTDGVTFTRDLDLPTEHYELLTSGDLRTSGLRRLRRDDDVTLEALGKSRRYERVVATDAETGTELRATIEVAQDSDLLRVGAPVAAGIVALALLAVGLVPRRRKPPPAAEAVVEPAPTSA